jgi:hypothetical protein
LRGVLHGDTITGIWLHDCGADRAWCHGDSASFQ